jgi:hypothetical protein
MEKFKYQTNIKSMNTCPYLLPNPAGQGHLISVQRSDSVFLLETDGLFEGP